MVDFYVDIVAFVYATQLYAGELKRDWTTKAG